MLPLIAVPSKDNLDVGIVDVRRCSDQVIQTLLQAHISSMQRDEFVRGPSKTRSCGAGVFSWCPSQCPRSHSLHGRLTDTLLDEVLSHAVRIDRNACCAASQSKFKPAYRTGDLRTPFHPGLERCPANYVVKHQSIGSAEHPTRNRCVGATRGRGDADDDIGAWPRRQGRQTAQENNPFVQSPASGRVISRNVIPPPTNLDTLVTLGQRHMAGHQWLPIRIMREDRRDHDLVAQRRVVLGHASNVWSVTRQLWPVIAARYEDAHLRPRGRTFTLPLRDLTPPTFLLELRSRRLVAFLRALSSLSG